MGVGGRERLPSRPASYGVPDLRSGSRASLDAMDAQARS